MPTSVACDLLTRPEAAAYIGMRPQTLAAWAVNKRHQIPVVKLARTVRYRKADLDKFIESHVVGTLAD